MTDRERGTASGEFAQEVEKVVLAIRVNDALQAMFRCYEQFGTRLTPEDEEQIVRMLLKPFSNRQLDGVIIDLAWIKTVEGVGNTGRSIFFVSNEIARRGKTKK